MSKTTRWIVCWIALILLATASCSRQPSRASAGGQAAVTPSAPPAADEYGQPKAPAAEPAPPATAVPATAVPVAEPAPASAPVVLPRNTKLVVRLDRSLSTRTSRAGTRFTATLDQPLQVNGAVVAPRGSVCHGHVTRSAASGRLKGRASLSLVLDTLVVNGKSYPVATTAVSRASAGHKKRNLGIIGGGAGLGAALGAIAGGGRGAAIGAVAGGGAGTAGAAATGRQEVTVPAESLLTFSLRAPVRL